MDENKAKVSQNGQGPVYTKEDFVKAIEVTSLPQVREFLKRDLSTAIHMLDAVYRDANTLNALADYLYGRLQNLKNQEELKKQPQLFDEK